MRNLIKIFSVAVLSMLVVGTVANDANAGGKSANGTIVFINNTGLTQFVIVNPSAALQAAFANKTITQPQFLAAGGQILNPGGESKPITAKAGKNSAVNVPFFSMGQFGTPVFKTVTVASGKKTTVTIR